MSKLIDLHIMYKIKDYTSPVSINGENLTSVMVTSQVLLARKLICSGNGMFIGAKVCAGCMLCLLKSCLYRTTCVIFNINTDRYK